MSKKRDFGPVKLMGGVGLGIFLGFALGAISNQDPKLFVAGAILLVAYVIFGFLMMD
jgi:hypothetical protein